MGHVTTERCKPGTGEITAPAPGETRDSRRKRRFTAGRRIDTPSRVSEGRHVACDCCRVRRTRRWRRHRVLQTTEGGGVLPMSAEAFVWWSPGLDHRNRRRCVSTRKGTCSCCWHATCSREA